MRDEDTLELIDILKHVGVIGQDEIDARMVIVGKHDARVIDDHAVFILEDRHVLSDGIQTA